MSRPYTHEPEWPYVLRLASELAADPALLSLRTKRLVADLQAARRVGISTARQAVAAARRMVAP